MYLFEMNRNKPELHEGVKWKKAAHHRELNQTP